ncbi:MAG: hypothetical protein UH541_11450 [Prevotella sp.]|nr:hypothetical protein [Prevotella sp.]
MAYVAYVTTLKNLRKHPNADRLQLAECFGNTVCVSMEYVADQVGVYFPTDGQLSMEFCEQNGLLAVYVDGVNVSGGYMDAEKRNVKTIKLRGEKSDGLFLPLTCLAYTGVDIDTIKVGDTISVVNGHEICTKYIPKRNHKSHSNTSEGNRTRKKKVPVAPLFAEHADTEQLAYNLSAFKPGDEIEITLKMHGTSGRTARLPVLKGYKRTLLDRILRREGTPIYEDGYVSGTRRVVLEDYSGGFYGDNSFREKHSKIFEGKLMKGETVYYEIVGFTDSGAPIMGDGNNEKVGKDFVKQYGKTTTFSYGCYPEGKVMKYSEDEHGTFSIPVEVPKSDIYVYRMTMTNEEGFVVEYTPDFMRYRCEQMGVKTVPVFWKGIITPTTKTEECQEYACWCGEWVGACGGEAAIGDMVKEIAEKFYAGPDPIGKTHTREGVVVRIINRPKFCAYKHKNFEFKVLEGIIKEVADAPDMEESQECLEEVQDV